MRWSERVKQYMSDRFPIFRYKRCLACGRKTLVYPNGFCRDCRLLIKLKDTVTRAPPVSN